MDDAEIRSIWLTLGRLSSIFENAHEKGPSINGPFDRPTITFSSDALKWINRKDTNPYSVLLRKKNGPTLGQKDIVLKELEAEVAQMKADISTWKVAYAHREKNPSDTSSREDEPE